MRHRRRLRLRVAGEDGAEGGDPGRQVGAGVHHRPVAAPEAAVRAEGRDHVLDVGAHRRERRGAGRALVEDAGDLRGDVRHGGEVGDALAPGLARAAGDVRAAAVVEHERGALAGARRAPARSAAAGPRSTCRTAGRARRACGCWRGRSPSATRRPAPRAGCGGSRRRRARAPPRPMRRSRARSPGRIEEMIPRMPLPGRRASSATISRLGVVVVVVDRRLHEDRARRRRRPRVSAW